MADVRNLSGKDFHFLSPFFIVLIIGLTFFAESALAEPLSSNPVTIRVDRLVQVETGGAVVISDSVTLSANRNATAEPLRNLVVGLPYAYQGSLFYYFAYEDMGRLNIKANVNLDGFYGINVQFREPLDLAQTGSYNFTVVYVLSGLVVLSGERFNVSFPQYPIFEREVDFYNLTVVLPPRTLYVNSSLHFDNRTIVKPQYSYQILNRTESDIRPFSNQTALITFGHSGFPKRFLLIDVNRLERKITVDPWGSLLVSDFYEISNEGESISNIPLYLPMNASEVSAHDVYGSVGVNAELEEDNYKPFSVSLREPLKKDEKIKLTLDYRLPFKMYVRQSGFEDYTLTLDFLNLTQFVARRVTVEANLPEGAQSQSRVNSDLNNVTRFDNLNFDIRYRYNFLWASFRPVSWVGVLAVVFSAILYLRGAAKPAVAIAPVVPDTLRKFVDAYEEKTRILLELKSMERQVRTGKLSRRRQSLRRTSLDSRLSALAKELTDLRSEIEAAGGRHADMMRQLEVAEADLETLEEDIQRVEARHRRKQLSAEASRRLLDEYNRRRERAENAISGVILRLKEQIQ